MNQAEVVALVIPVVMALVGLVKPALEATVLPTTAKLHDPALRILAVALATLAAPVVYLARTPHPDPLGFWSTAGAGLVAGLAAAGLYVVARGEWTATSGQPGA